MCPKCGGPGSTVKTITLKRMVIPEFLELASKPGFSFCARPDCEVVYFRPTGETLSKQDVQIRIGLKETEEPVRLCYCFGFTRAMVEEEIRATGRCTIPRRIAAEMERGNCACEWWNPQGTCCLGNVADAVRTASRASAR